MLKIGVYGATGRTGSFVVKLLANDLDARLSTVFSLEDIDDSSIPKDCIVTSSREEFLKASDVIIDFSSPEGLESLLSVALDKEIYKPMVIATTGLNEHQKNLLRQATEVMPVVYSTNMSLGVALLNKLVAISAKLLREFDCEIVEQHHRHKKDAPSGTALTLASHVANARGLDLDSIRISGRDGNIGARTKDEIAVMSLRGGDIAGRHTVGFYNDGEFIELHHTATSRETFAAGSIKAAKWLAKQPIGLYQISDCLGI